jgi:hypothetical protein
LLSFVHQAHSVFCDVRWLAPAPASDFYPHALYMRGYRGRHTARDNHRYFERGCRKRQACPFNLSHQWNSTAGAAVGTADPCLLPCMHDCRTAPVRLRKTAPIQSDSICCTGWPDIVRRDTAYRRRRLRSEGKYGFDPPRPVEHHPSNGLIP